VNEHDLLRSLEGIDQPRTPRAEFERSLREELLGERHSVNAGLPPVHDAAAILEPVVLPVRSRPARRRGIALVAASLVVLAAVAGTVVVQGARNDTVDVRGPAVTRVPDARAACDRFTATAFSGLPRAQFLGVTNRPLFADARTAMLRLRRFRSALETLQQELSKSVVHSDALTVSLDRARALADSAIHYASSNRLTKAASEVHDADRELLALARELTELGVARCL
jgi:hypothetical protein